MRKNNYEDQMPYEEAQSFYDSYSEETALDQQQVARYIAKVMAWMCVGLFTTFVFAMVALFVPSIFYMIFTNPYMYYGIWGVQLLLVFAFTASLSKMGSGAATACYLLYSAATGLTFSSLVVIFELSSLLYVFCLTGVIFLLMAVYGFATKKDLTRMGSLMMFCLFGLIISSLTNMFILRSSMVDLALCCLGVVIFIGLIAYDTQKIKGMYTGALAAGHEEGSDEIQKIAIYGAFALYLDFINMFLRLLRLFGKRRN